MGIVGCKVEAVEASMPLLGILLMIGHSGRNGKRVGLGLEGDPGVMLRQLGLCKSGST